MLVTQVEVNTNCATDVKKKKKKEKKKKEKRPPETRHMNQYRVFITLVHFTGVRVGERKKRGDDDNANRTF